MPDSGSYRGDTDDANPGDATAAPAGGTPRWVKVAGVIALVVLVMLLVALLTGGKHGPGRHLGDRGARAVLAVAPNALGEHSPPPPNAART
jgi:hypothetical protein